jgi:hypothetical protein
MVSLLVVMFFCFNWCLSLGRKWSDEKCSYKALSGSATKEGFHIGMLVNMTASAICQWNQNCLTPWTTLPHQETDNYSSNQEIVQSIGTEMVISLYLHQENFKHNFKVISSPRIMVCNGQVLLLPLPYSCFCI